MHLSDGRCAIHGKMGGNALSHVAKNFFGDVADGCSSAVELIMFSYSFEDHGIASAEDVETMSVNFKLRDTDYNTIDTFTVEVPIESK